MFIKHEDFAPELQAYLAAAEAAATEIAPLFPLDRAVAVNPFHGQADTPIALAAARLERAAGLRIFPDRSQQAARIASGEVTEADITQALNELSPGSSVQLLSVLAALHEKAPDASATPTVAELVAATVGTDWLGLVTERIGAWAQGYFDRGHALWGRAPRPSAWADWRDWATHDLTPEILGCKGFAELVSQTDRNPARALAEACAALGLDVDAAPAAFRRLLWDMGGWAGHARQLSWEAELQGETDNTLCEMLTIRLVWEQALYAQFGAAIAEGWGAACQRHRQPIRPRNDHLVDAVLLRASEIASGRRLDDVLAASVQNVMKPGPSAQLVFCIDVRSERYRRALETVAPEIQTHGAAGFFGITLKHRRAASNETEAHCPVLLSPGLESRETRADDTARRIRGRTKRAVSRFSRAAVSSFAFVESAGLLRVGDLLSGSLSLGRNKGDQGPAPQLTLDPTDPQAAEAAETALRTMGLTGPFAPLVVFVGHEAHVTNDAQSGLLQCGACGGHSGATNARALAQLLNEGPLRQALSARGLEIPDTTVFKAAIHDTASDTVTVYGSDPVAVRHQPSIKPLQRALDGASAIARAERSVQLPGRASPDALAERGADWAQTRVEWGLAGCSWFIAAPRAATAGRDLAGRAFLHDYDCYNDPDGNWLAQILGGPVCVAAWINLQYYGATVVPDAFSAGNKLVHNVVGGFGVLDGTSGALRGGPSLQGTSIGGRQIHEPVRLQVRIASPQALIDNALDRAPLVKAMHDSGWLSIQPTTVLPRGTTSSLPG